MTRTLPHRAEAEASVLGGVLIKPDVLTDIPDLEPEDFYDLRNRTIFAAMRNLEATGTPIDLVTVEDTLHRTGKWEAIGGIAYLGELTLRVPTPDNVAIYARLVRELAQVRTVLLTAGSIVATGYDPDLDPREFVRTTAHAIDAVLQADVHRGGAGAQGIGVLTGARLRSLDALAAARARGEALLTGLPTGIPALDRELGGYQPGILNLIAARPAMGKSALALAGAEATVHAGYGVHVFSLEDSAIAYADRCLSRGSGVPVKKIRAAAFDAGDIGPLAAAAARFHALSGRWKIDADNNLTSVDIVRRVRAEKRTLGTRLVIVDYLQLVQRDPALSEHAALDQIMGVFQNAAKDDGGTIAWVVLSQLNREVEKRIDKRAQLSDLRGSGTIEEKCKVILAIYRGAYYSDTPKRDIDYDCDCRPGVPAAACPHMPDDETFQTTAQILMLKNNQGRPCAIWARWYGPTTEFR